MKPEAQRIAIAEACGFTKLEWQYKNCDGPYEMELVGIGNDEECRTRRIIVEVPDYLNDLNAMHEAEKILDDTQRLDGFPTNEHITQLDVYYSRLEGVIESSGSPRYEFQARASQRAEAFLRTLNLWTE